MKRLLLLGLLIFPKSMRLSLFCIFLAVGTLSAQNVGINTDGSTPGMLLDLKPPASATSDGLRINNPNTADGDAILNLQNNGVSTWTFGMDDSDSDKLKFSNSGALGTSDRLTLHTGGFIEAHADFSVADTAWSSVHVSHEARFEMTHATAGTSTDTTLVVKSINGAPTALIRKSFLQSGPTLFVAGSSDTCGFFYGPLGTGVIGVGGIAGLAGFGTSAGVTGEGQIGVYGTGSSVCILGVTNSTTGRGGEFRINEATNSEMAVFAETFGTGYALRAQNNNNGLAAQFIGDLNIQPNGANADITIDNSGGVNEPTIVATLNNYGVLGTSTRRWFDIHTTNMTYYGTLTNGSDLRIKENVTELNGGLSKLALLRPVRYDLKADLLLNSTTPKQKRDLLEYERKNKIGFIAQEVEQVLPELVKNHTDSGLKSVNYIGMIPLLVDAVQELSTQNKQLLERVEKLEQQLANSVSEE